jgi:phage terminase small subunit
VTSKQTRFVHEYLIDLNATQAAIRAGYSAKTARSIGSDNLTKPDIQQALAKRKAQQLTRADVNADKVLTGLARIAFSDPRQLFDENGKLLDVTNWPEDVAGAVSRFDIPKDGEGIKIRFNDRVRALEMLAKHLRLLSDVTVTAKMDIDFITMVQNVREKLVSQG